MMWRQRSISRQAASTIFRLPTLYQNVGNLTQTPINFACFHSDTSTCASTSTRSCRAARARPDTMHPLSLVGRHVDSDANELVHDPRPLLVGAVDASQSTSFFTQSFALAKKITRLWFVVLQKNLTDSTLFTSTPRSFNQTVL